MKQDSYEWRLGEILVQNGWISWDQLTKALEQQVKARESMGERLSAKGLISVAQEQTLQVGEILIQKGWITWDQLKEGLDDQKKTNRMIGEILVEKGYVKKADLYRALASQFNKVFVEFKKITIPKEVLNLVPRSFAYEYRIMPLLKKDGIFLMAVSDPKDVRPEIAIRKYISECEIRTAIATPEEIRAAIEQYYGKE